jgi:hypothetical protein
VYISLLESAAIGLAHIVAESSLAARIESSAYAAYKRRG